MINFAGTKGNNGQQYFRTDDNGNSYYSFETTIDIGNIPHPGIVEGTPIDIKQTGSIQAPVYIRYLNSDNKPNSTKQKYMFVDWDSSSGVLCGNTWGKCSDMAEIYMNILSPNADNPILGDKQLQKIFCENFINYNGSNWERLFNNKLRAPYCMGANIWSQDSTYNCGVMGPDWFYIMDYNENGYIPVYGHLGSTYGFNSGHVYFPPGKITAYKPWKNYKNSYTNPLWNITFHFCGGNEFTISQAHNNNNDDQTGVIQEFINLVIKDQFKWK